MNPVYLPFRGQGLGTERGYEPQVLKLLSQNRAKLYLKGEEPFQTMAWNFPLVGGQRVKRLAITRLRAVYNIHNITSSNNTFGYYISGFPTLYDGVRVVTLTPGQYNTTELIAELQAELNADTPVGYNFSVGTFPNNPLLISVTLVNVLPAIPRTFALLTSFTTSLPSLTNRDFVATALNNTYGLGLRGITISEASQVANRTTVLNGYLVGFGVRYFDVCSRSLTMDSKTMLPDLNAASGMLTRLYLPHPYAGEIDERYSEPAAWINVEDRPITSIDLQLVPSQFYPPTSMWSDFRLAVEVEVTIEF